MEIFSLSSREAIELVVILSLFGLLLLQLARMGRMRQQQRLKRRIERLYGRSIDDRSRRNGGAVMAEELYGGLSEMVETLNKTMDELDLPKADIESTQQVFARMPAELRSKLEPFLGPPVSEEVAGLVVQKFELIAKMEEARARLAFYQNQRAHDNYQIGVNSKFTPLDLETALKGVDAAAKVAEEYGEEEAEALRKVLRRRAIHAICERFLNELPGASDPEAIRAVEQTIPLITASEPATQIDAEAPPEGEGVPLDGVYEEIDTRSNGH